MTMAFDGGNNINVANILPSDNPVATKIFTVTGNNTTELHMGYSLYLVVDENTFNTYSIQYRLRSENTGGSGTVAVENEELISLKNDKHIYLLGYGTFDAPTDGNKVHTYTLEIYFPHMLFNQNEDQGKIFKSHIVIEDYSLVSDRMMSAIKIKEKITRMDMYNYFSEKYLYEYTQRNDLNEEQREDLLAISDNYTNMASDIFNELTSVKFLNTTLNNSSIESIDFVDINVVPGGVLGSFDISEKQNGSVMLWYENGSVAGRYKITIGQNGGVRAPTHADSLFGFLRNLKTINGNVNTSQTKTMSYMFYSTGANVNSFIADLSNWNVSNVTDMSNLFVFSGFNSLIWNVGNLNNWDVSNVVNMSGVFSSAGYSATTWNIGDLSNWNVSNVTNMTQTFCFSGFTSASWTIGDLSNWDVSNVISMANMFDSAGYNAITWSIGNLDNWDVSNITDMAYMFNRAGYSANTWSIGDLSNWNISKVRNLNLMFRQSGHKTQYWTVGDLSNWDTINVETLSMIFAGAGNSATTWSVGNISNWDLSSLTNSACNAFLQLGTAATNNLASVKSAWGC